MEKVSHSSIDYIDYLARDRTLKFRLDGNGAYIINRPLFIESLKSIGASDIESIWKAEEPLEVFVLFKSKATVESLEDLGKFKVSRDVTALVTKAGDTIKFIRFHWVPAFIKNELFQDYLEAKKLRVLASDTLKDNADGYTNGIRQFKIMGSTTDIHALPHILDFDQCGFQSLLRIPGRDPMCLKCKQLGHLRQSCPSIYRRPPPPQANSASTSSNRRWEDSQSRTSTSFQRPQHDSSPDSDSEKEDQPDDLTKRMPREREKEDDNVEDTSQVVDDPESGEDVNDTTLTQNEGGDAAVTETVEDNENKDYVNSENGINIETDIDDSQDKIPCSNPDNVKRKKRSTRSARNNLNNKKDVD